MSLFKSNFQDKCAKCLRPSSHDLPWGHSVPPALQVPGQKGSQFQVFGIAYVSPRNRHSFL